MKKLFAVALLLGLGISISGCANVYPTVKKFGDFDATVEHVTYAGKASTFQNAWFISLIPDVPNSFGYTYYILEVLSTGNQPPFKVGQRINIERVTITKTKIKGIVTGKLLIR